MTDIPLHQRAMQLALTVRNTAIYLGAAEFALAQIEAGISQKPLAEAEAAVVDAARIHRRALWEWHAAAEEAIVQASEAKTLPEEKAAGYVSQGGGY